MKIKFNDHIEESIRCQPKPNAFLSEIRENWYIGYTLNVDRNASKPQLLPQWEEVDHYGTVVGFVTHQHAERVYYLAIVEEFTGVMDQHGYSYFKPNSETIRRMVKVQNIKETVGLLKLDSKIAIIKK